LRSESLLILGISPADAIIEEKSAVNILLFAVVF